MILEGTEVQCPLSAVVEGKLVIDQLEHSDLATDLQEVHCLDRSNSLLILTAVVLSVLHPVPRPAALAVTLPQAGRRGPKGQLEGRNAS